MGVIVFGRPYRRLLGDPHLYLAAIVSIAMLTPVFVWNLQHEFASFSFHLSDRHGGGYVETSNNALGFIGYHDPEAHQQLVAQVRAEARTTLPTEGTPR